MLYTLNLYSVVCHLYFNKTGRKKKQRRNKLAYDTEKSAPGCFRDMGRISVCPLTLISTMLPS